MLETMILMSKTDFGSMIQPPSSVRNPLMMK